jgi:hypothetical protein
MSCGNKSNTIQKTFIIEPIDIGAPTASACTALYTNLLVSCSGNTSVQLGTNEIVFNGDSIFQSITANTIEATTFTSGGTNILDIVNASDTFITGGTFSDVSDTLTLLRNDGANVIVTGLTNFYVTGGTYNNNTNRIYFDRNDTLSAFTVDLSTLDVNDTFVSGFTYDGNNNLTIARNDNQFFTATINTFSGLTINGDLTVTGTTTLNTLNVSIISATTISATTIIGDGSGLSGVSTEDNFVTGGTYSAGTLSFSGTNSATTFSVDVSDLLDDTNTFVTGQTFNGTTYILTTTRNDGFLINTDLSVLANDVYVLSGVYNPQTGIVTYTNSSGGTFEVSGFTTGMTDSYTTAATLSGESITFDNNIQGTNYYNVSLTPLLSGKTDNSVFNSYTSTTQTSLSGKVDTTLFNSYTSSTDTILDGKVEGGQNVGGANEIFKDKSGTTLNFRTLSGGSNTTITQVGDIQRIDVAIPADTNTFVTGFTYDDSNNLTITRNDGTAFTTTIDTFSGLTINGDLNVTGNTTLNILSATTISATTFIGDGSGLVGVSSEDNFVSAATFNSTTNIISFSGTNSATTFNVSLSALSTDNFYVTGFTYDSNNNFTVSLNNNSAYTITLTTLSGLTINGDLNVTGDSTFNSITATTITASTISATTFYGDGSGLIGVSGEDNYVTGGTYNTGTTSIDFSGTNSATTFSVDVSPLANLNIIDIDNITGKISLIGYGETTACKIQRVETIGTTAFITWANGDDTTLDKIWVNRYTYSYF